MAVALDREIRRLLDRAVRKARLVVEDGARKALTELGLEDGKRPDGLSPARGELRNRLRAHARSLGDATQSDGSIKANRLVREIAYEHWHRSLFARFLAENNLLIDPDHEVAVSLSDLEDIAKEEGRDLIELAADWAEPMLPQIFRKDDPVLALSLPPETKAGITDIVKGLPRAVFAADDSLGWLYQFWQADQKDQVNESEVKIGADELPAVTQLFTEDYMVLFLLENTLGAWWAGKVLATDRALAEGAGSEEELREKTSPPGYRWTYLRFAREPRDGETYDAATGPWRPAAGAFEDWPKAARDITVLDPCMGSGHFLVFAMPIIVAFRRAEEELDERVAVNAVLAENLFGLEIDPRCTQIAAFALALASWKRLGGPQPLSRLNIACSGLAVGLGKSEFLRLAEKVADAEGWGGEQTLLGTERPPLGLRAVARIRGGLERLYELFELAPHLGSLIDPHKAVTGDNHGYGSLLEESYDQFSGLLQKVLDERGATLESRELAVTAQGLAKAAELLSRRYTLIATNVPYLGRGRQTGILKSACERIDQATRGDLAYTFYVEFNRSSRGLTSAFVLPHNWLFLTSYEKARRKVLTSEHWHMIARLGAGAFETIGGQVVSVYLSIASTLTSLSASERIIRIIDHEANADHGAPETLQSGQLQNTNHALVLANPSHRVFVDKSGRTENTRLRDCASIFQGSSTGDSDKFERYIWEVHRLESRWKPFLSPSRAGLFSGRHRIIDWPAENCELASYDGARIRGREAWNSRGFCVAASSDVFVSIYLGEIYNKALSSIILKNPNDAVAFAAYLQSEEFHTELRRLDQKLMVAPGAIMDVPFERERWHSSAGDKFPSDLPNPYSNDPTQWLFDGHPGGSADPNASPGKAANPRLVTAHGVRPGVAEHPLQVAVARLLGHHWPRQTGSSFMDCPAVPEPDEVDRSGLIDADGIVPLPPLAGEADAATRLRDLIRAVWGPAYGESTIRDLLAAEEAKATDLGNWLTDEFFDGHCKVFHQAPFIWHVWDGVRGGFSALVNYHRLCEGNGAGRRLLEKLRDSYLGEWIAVQRRALTAGEAGAEERLIAAEHLRGELTKIIDGNPPYDIFVRWKPLHRQPIGWEPDVDDGVRLNIRPFLIARPKNSGRKDGCILRVTPRVKKHAGADRGAEPLREKHDYPWFWANNHDTETTDFTGGAQFKGRRYNDFHYTRAFKQRVRDAKARAVSGDLSEPVLENQGRTL